jgi:flavin-dependent dehydrogenase
MLAGDAAGLVNPLTGEGIDLAIESGELAGEVAAEALRRGELTARGLRPYERLCEATFGRVLRLNGWLGLVFAVPWLLDRIFKAGLRSPALREDLAQIALGGQRAAITPRMVAACVLG